MAGGMRFTIPAPRDYHLSRDACSYGYFLLAPNHWSPGERVLTRVLDLEDGPATLRIGQDRRGAALGVKADRALSRREKAEAVRLVSRMLRLDEPADSIREFHRLDPRWKRAGRGRLFRSPTVFEDVIKTVTSCNVTWPSTVTMNRRLCEVVGRGGAFPSAGRLARARPATLRARCRVGYRDARIIELARLFSSKPSRGGVDVEWMENPATPDDAIHDALLELPGIGPYAAANIMQLLGRYHRLPLDTESVRHGRTLLGYKGSPAKVMKHVHKHYAPFGAHAFRSYWFEMWEFYESKHGPASTWERDSTGKLFTAALLNKA